ncbi:Putative electron transport protein YccM [Methylovirgula sp. HY1]|nr:Putative electron transport protein YccM [Methylovirgula sp. HY1]
MSSSAPKRAKDWPDAPAEWPVAARLDANAAVAALGAWLRRHQRLIQNVQWAVVGLYLLLVAVPAFLPLPGQTAYIWNNLTLFAQFCFWGIWWPFVLLSMVLVGRAWCGLMCPEGNLTEVVSRHGRGLAIPGWLKWKGWPFVAFSCTTIYGQMISVYQYPKPVLLILGGSTAGAIAIGYLYGRNKRVWCRYLCPVNGVFGLLAKLAPLHFHVDAEAWERNPPNTLLNSGAQAAHRSPPLNCAPLVAIRTMKGGSDCHMCGRCDGFRGAVTLQLRSPTDEIVRVAGATPKPWETVLILFGLMGVAVGAFHWSASPWFVEIKQDMALWLINHGLTFVLALQPPWWILTDYPARNDMMTVLDGSVLIGYILATAVVMGGLLCLSLAAATSCLGRWSMAKFHHLAQALIPMAGSGVVLGLSALTVTLLRNEGFGLGFVPALRALFLAGAAVWSLYLGWKIAGLYSKSRLQQAVATVLFGSAVGLGVLSWVLLFFVW